MGAVEVSNGIVRVQPTLAEHFADLRRPFTTAAVKVKPLTKAGRDGKSSAAFYIDARLAVERLNAVVGPDHWSDEYRLLADGSVVPALHYPIECRLTVCGVTRCDVGQLADSRVDDKAWKSAYSDALKRAAVKFGIGAYLYAIPRLRATANVVDGKVQGFTHEGEQTLRGAYERWLGNPELNRFGDPLDHGDIDFDDVDPVVVSATAGEERVRRATSRLPVPDDDGPGGFDDIPFGDEAA